MPKNTGCEKLNKDWVRNFVNKWERRHDDWAKGGQYKRNDGQKFRDFSEFKTCFRERLLSDWRDSLAFFIDRTTYQGFGDQNAEKVSRYMTDKIYESHLPREYSKGSQDEVAHKIGEITRSFCEEKSSNHFTTIRWKTDIGRFASVVNYLMYFSDEKNFTKIVQNENYDQKILRRFSYVGDKVINFYLKFLSLILELPGKLPIVVDTHVKQSLVRHCLVDEQEMNNLQMIKEKIISNAKGIGVTPIELETALYEENFEIYNRNRLSEN